MSELNGELWRDIYYASFDDLRLHVRHYPVTDAKARPVVCLPGLTRNARDFHYLASYLSHHPQRPRAVYCVDYRGRGIVAIRPPLAQLHAVYRADRHARFHDDAGAA